MPAADLQIRELTAGDVEAFRGLRARALREHPEWFGEPYEEFVSRPIEDVIAWMASQRSFTCGAFLEGGLVGMARCSKVMARKSAHQAFVTSVYVAPEARGRGAGRRLMEAVIAGASRWPEVEELRLAVVTENTAASSLYKSLGFTVYGVEPRAMKIGHKYVDEELMYMLLQQRTGPAAGTGATPRQRRRTTP